MVNYYPSTACITDEFTLVGVTPKIDIAEETTDFEILRIIHCSWHGSGHPISEEKDKILFLIISSQSESNLFLMSKQQSKVDGRW